MTIPHKEAALALADEATEARAAIGAANTLTFGADGTIAAENTDAPGLIAALPRVARRARRALVLGAGGSARAVVWALREAGAARSRVEPHARARAGAGRRARRARGGRAEPADLLVNCTSVGLEPVRRRHPHFQEPAGGGR